MKQNYKIMLFALKSIKMALVIFIENKSIKEAFDLAMKCKSLLGISDKFILLDTISVSPEDMFQYYEKHPEYAKDFEYCLIDDFLNGGYKKYEKEDWA